MYSLSDKVKRVMQAENITEDELEFLLTHSAITSLHEFNRRYHHWIFKIVDDEVVDMAHAKMQEVGNNYIRNTRYSVEQHDFCSGKGCSDCGWHGKVVEWF